MSLSTPHQRLYIRTLLREQELPTDVITTLHRRAFEQARVELPAQGLSLDLALCALNRLQASQLIDALKQQGGET